MSIDEIASSRNIGRDEVVQYYRRTGMSAGRGNAGTSVFLRHKGAHGSVIAAILGLQENRPLEDDVELPEDTSALAHTEEAKVPDEEMPDLFDLDLPLPDHSASLETPDYDNLPKTNEGAVSQKVSENESVERFKEGQLVTINEDVVLAQEKLSQFSGRELVVVHVFDDLLTLEPPHDETEDGAHSEECTVRTSEVTSVNEPPNWVEGDEAIYTGREEHVACQIRSIFERDGEQTRYSLIIKNAGKGTSERAYATSEELQPLPIDLVETRNLVGQEFHYKGIGCHAVGEATADGGIRVAAGSYGRTKRTASVSRTISFLRLDLLESGHIAIDGEKLMFNRDYSFSTPSAASSFLSGSNIGGPTTWVTPDGRFSYKEMKERTSERVGEEK
jgi:hypothetical protein